MNSFGQQLPSQHQIKPEPKSGNHQMPPTLPLHRRKKKKKKEKEKDSVRKCTHAHTHGPACTRAGAAAVPHTKGAHAHTQKQRHALCICQVMQMIGAADECRLTGDERVHVAAETMAGRRLGRGLFKLK